MVLIVAAEGGGCSHRGGNVEVWEHADIHDVTPPNAHHKWGYMIMATCARACAKHDVRFHSTNKTSYKEGTLLIYRSLAKTTLYQATFKAIQLVGQ